MSNYKLTRDEYAGAQTTETSITRVGGATDGTQAQSTKIVTNAQATFLTPYRELPMAIWNDVTGTDVNVTVYGTANSASLPLNDEIWMECQYLGNASSPLASFKSSSKSHPLAAGAAVASDGSTWDTGVAARVSSQAYALGSAVKVASNPGRVFLCTGAGTSAASEPVAAAASTNAFSTSDKSANVSLSLANLKATMSSTGAGGVRSVYGQATGKFYFEFTIGSTSNLDVGIAIATASLTTGTTIGRFVVIPISGTVWLNNGSTSVSFGALSVGQVVCGAIDLVNQRGWFRINGGNWNNNAANDPTTNIGGVDISVLFANAAAFVIFDGSVAATNATVNFGATAFAQSVPSGFAAGPSQNGYATAVEGDVIVDGNAVFRAAYPFKLTATLTSPQPQQRGYIYARVLAGKPSTTFYIDPKVDLVSTGGVTNGPVPVKVTRDEYSGSQITETAITRVGGASTGGVATSAKLVTNTQATFLTPLRALPLAIWNDVTGADRSVTVYGTVNSALLPLNDEIWVEVQYLGDASYPLAKFKSSGKSHPLAAGAAVASDGSTWNGGGSGAGWSPFKLTATLTSPQPQQKGYITARVLAAKASATYYIDPMITLATVVATVVFTSYGGVSGGSASANTAAVNAFNAAWAGSSVILTIPPGTYDFAGGILGSGIRNLVVNGYGAELRGTIWFGCFPPMQPYGDTSAFVHTVSAGANSATVITTGHAARFAVGNKCVVTSFDMQGSGSQPPNPFNWDYVTITNITGNVITFAETVASTHLETYPCYDPGQGNYPVTSFAAISQGGPATLYKLGSDWDIQAQYNGLTITPPSGQGLNAEGRDMTFYQCSGADQGPVCSVSKRWRMLNCNFPNYGIEVDKIVDELVIDGTTLSSVFTQSSSPKRATITNSHLYLNSCGRNVYTSGNTLSGALIGVAGYGRTDSWESVNDSIASVSHGGILITDVQGTYTLSAGGILSIPLYAGPQRWAVPGTWVFFSGATETEGAPFQVTDVTTDGGTVYATISIAFGLKAVTSNIDIWPSSSVVGKPISIYHADDAEYPGGFVLHTTITGWTDTKHITVNNAAPSTLSAQTRTSICWGSTLISTSGLGSTWPSLPTTGGHLNFQVVPTRSLKFTNVTGCADSLDLSGYPVGTLLHEGSQRTYSFANGSWATGVPFQLPAFQLWGQVVKITFNVTKAYMGAQSSCILSAPWRNIGNQVNLKIAGTRVLNYSGGNFTGVTGAQSGDSWTDPLGNGYWIGTSYGPYLETNISGDATSTWPTVEIIIELDQGIP